MELVAWATHKYLMHGFLWFLHKDHHQIDHTKNLQKNDWFFMIFAIPGSALIILNSVDLSFGFFIGLGITLYGFAYFIVHEIFIHQRIKILKHTNSSYLKGIRRAHKIHHKNLQKEEGSCFGMLFVPRKYLKN
jgi:beta-carotene 3-hydroxylase